MSVPSWLRSESKTKFLHCLYKLNIRIGEIVANHPKKYRANYGDNLISNALLALNHAQMANSIFMNANTPADDFRLRRQHLREARGRVETVSTVAYIYLELISKTDGAPKNKLLKQEEEIGLACSEISKMLRAVLDSDRRIYNNSRHKDA